MARGNPELGRGAKETVLVDDDLFAHVAVASVVTGAAGCGGFGGGVVGVVKVRRDTVGATLVVLVEANFNPPGADAGTETTPTPVEVDLSDADLASE